jgi:gamma-glutamylcyclotransferase (GGCT)/AIG2-like uncharacterized protein YtfP
VLYFAYGSNLHLGHLQRRCSDVIALGRARLPGYRIAFRYPSTSFPGGSAADIIPESGSEVWGALFRIHAADLEFLDDFEDLDQGGYRRIRVEVIDEEEQAREAWSYEVVSKLAHDFKPVPEYLDLMIGGARDFALPEDYIESISRLASEAPPFAF